MHQQFLVTHLSSDFLSVVCIVTLLRLSSLREGRVLWKESVCPSHGLSWNLPTIPELQVDETFFLTQVLSVSCLEEDNSLLKLLFVLLTAGEICPKLDKAVKYVNC